MKTAQEKKMSRFAHLPTDAQREHAKMEAFARGDNPIEAINEFDQTRVNKRGGARPGAGRKPGKWAKSKSREHVILCRVTPECKNLFLSQAAEMHMTQTDYLQWLILQQQEDYAKGI